MFTGIIESLGEVVSVEQAGTNVGFVIESAISRELKPDQSVSHNGVCLTVTQVMGNTHYVTAVRETLEISNLSRLTVGDVVNLERCLPINGRLDGHIVQGHVDQLGVCTSVRDENGSWLFDFEYDPKPENITVEKGSIAINGVSLTCFNSRMNSFRVAIIPYTFHNTNFRTLTPDSTVNLEFDVIGKYIRRILSQS